MKARIFNPFFLPVLAASLVLLLAGRATAQTFTNLHNFTAAFDTPGNDGAYPYGGLVVSSNLLYGTVQSGGSNADGAVFAINTTGTFYTNIYSFTNYELNSQNRATNSDGVSPSSTPAVSGNTLYGTCEGAGMYGTGTIFSLRTDGTAFTNLHNFSVEGLNAGSVYTNADGLTILGVLSLSGNALYGAAAFGGTNGNGTVFAIHTDGTDFTNLHTFSVASGPSVTNNDGINPLDGVIVSGNQLYGTAEAGGVFGNGTVFRLNTDGSGFTNLHSFSALISASPRATNSDGINPYYGGLAISGNVLYGTADAGGSAGWGTVFAINTDGSGFTNIHSFEGYPNDGSEPAGALSISGQTLYGVAAFGGSADYGTIFTCNTNGSGFTNLWNFDGGDGSGDNEDGRNSYGGVMLYENTLFGTASQGGSDNEGTVFGLILSNPPPPLGLVHSGTNLILTWSATGYTLQSATNLGPLPIWSSVGAQSPVTNPITGAQKFYRLTQ